MPTRVMKSLGEFFLDIIETIVIALSIFLVIYLFFIQPHQVSGQSMVPNFQNGEYLLTDKVSYKVGEPTRGDVIVFHSPSEAHCPEGTGCDFIKRIIGLPGESIELRDSTFYINGEPLRESYIPDSLTTLPGNFIQNRSVTLGENEYFVVGDNRPYSSDSRVWGPVTNSDIVGKAFFRYWPPSQMGVLPHAEYQ